MAIWKDSNNNLYDDMDGAALTLEIWPKDLIEISDEEEEALHPVPTVITPTEQTKEELRAEIQALMAKVEALTA